MLSIKLKTNEEIKGIQINGFEYKIVQLADDTTIFVNDLKSLEVSITEFLEFEKNVRPKIKSGKMWNYWIGLYDN